MATNTLSRLFVKIGADATGFEKAMNNVSSKMKNVGQKISSVGTSMTKWVTGPIVGATAAVGALATKTGNYADSILDLNAATGLSTDTIQEYQAVAERAGTKTTVLTDASEQLVKAMSRGEEGSANFRRGIGQLGLSFEELQNASPDKQMEMIMEALRGIEDPTQRAIAGQRLFKNSYQDLAPVLAMSAEKIEEVKTQANESGKVMSGSGLNSANKFRESMDKLKQQFTGAFREIAEKLIPVLNNQLIPAVESTVIPAIISFADTITGLIEGFMNLPGFVQKGILIFTGFLAAIGPVLVVVGNIIVAFSTMAPLIGTLGGLFSGLALGPIAAVIAAIGAVLLAWQNWDKIVVFVKWFSGKVMDYIEPLVENFVAGFETMKENTIGIFETMWDGVKRVINWLLGGVNKMIEGLNGLNVDIPKPLQKVLGMESFGFNLEKIEKLETSTANTDVQGGSKINIEKMEVRDDKDIEKVAKEIDRLNAKRNRRLAP